MRLALWSPSGDAGGPGALVPALRGEVSVVRVEGAPSTPPAADLDVYHLADDPAHGFVYRALLARPGLVVLEDWNLHRLVHAETAGRGDDAGYRREARHAHGEVGTFVARQVMRGLGGRLPTLVPMNTRVMEAALGVVALSTALRDLVAARLHGRPVVHLPLGFVGLPPLPERSRARADRGLPADRLVVLVLHAASTPAWDERIRDALGGLRETNPDTVITWSPDDAADLPTGLAAADVVVALEEPIRAGLGRAIARAAAGGRPILVAAGSGAARELPEGTVARVCPGPHETGEMMALLRRLLSDAPWRRHLGERAAAFAAQRGEVAPAARVLLALASSIVPTAERDRREWTVAREEETALSSLAREEVAWAARDLGLGGLPLDLRPLLGSLFERETR